MSARQVTRLLACAALGAGTLCIASTWTWDGTGSDDDWDTCANWSGPPVMPCYPTHPTNDDAIIPSGSWDVALINDEIDTLTIVGSVDFSSAYGTTVLATLEPHVLTIDASSGDIVITATDKAKINTKP